jgi:hypothetical protein
MDKDNSPALSSLSDRELGRHLMNRLYSIYDLGGVSCGRSLRAGLLESFIFFTEKPEDMEITDRALIEEARTRAFLRLSAEFQPEFPALIREIEHLSLETFTAFGILEMKRWYDRERDAEKFWPVGETTLVEALFELFGVPAILRQFKELNVTFSPLTLIEESKNRTRRRNETEMLRRLGY